VPHSLQKTETLSLQRLPCKQLVYNRPLMSMSLSTFSSETLSP
jgi:hypothetical protein